MLRDLTIENLALVKSLSMPLEEGLTVFTGETGAGKSLLLNALGLIGGGKFDPGMVRSGADRVVVEAVFDRPEGLPAEEFDTGEELIVRREMPTGSRQKILLDGAQLPAEKLAQLAPWLLEIHGQHAGQKLLREERHLDLLDRFADLGLEAAALKHLSATLYQMKTAAEEDAGRRAARREKMALFEFQTQELDAAKLSADEWAGLEAEQARLARVESQKALARAGYQALYEDDTALLSALARVEKTGQALLETEKGATEKEAGEPLRLLREAQVLLKEAAYAFRDLDDRLHAEPGRLAELDERMRLYHDLTRKYGGSLDKALAHLETSRAELAGLQAQETAVSRAATDLPQVTAQWQKNAAALQKKRDKGAKALQEAIRAELTELGLEKLEFSVEFLALQNPGPLAAGSHTARFRIAPNPGEPAMPLSRIASGGELSRLMLALSLVLTPERGLTLLFDEADAGIGGAVAEAVGRRLKKLASGHQVLCVTHLPQIAAQADQHYRVTKQEIGGRTLTAVNVLDGAGREEEIARMLDGDKLTPTAKAHARELLGGARKA